MEKYIFVIALALLMSADAWTKDFVGIVFDENKEPLPYCTVKVKNRNIAALGDSIGEFRLSVDKLRDKDTLTISYLGYNTREIPVISILDSSRISVGMIPAPTMLEAVTVIPAKIIKKKTKGKTHGSGLMLSCLDNDMAGECFGYEFHAKKNKRLVLESVGFFYSKGIRQMTKMKFRINVYDMSNVKKSPSSDFVNVLSKPVYFDYTLGTDQYSGKFEYKLQECIVLPEDAMVEIEFLENLNGEIFWYKSNLIGKRTWAKSLTDGEWERNPFATPFFVKCVEIDKI